MIRGKLFNRTLILCTSKLEVYIYRLILSMSRDYATPHLGESEGSLKSHVLCRGMWQGRGERIHLNDELEKEGVA